MAVVGERTVSGISYDRAGPIGASPLLLIHAGVADRRMWDGVWPYLIEGNDTVRLDLRGFGTSTTSPDGPRDHVADVIATMTELDLGPAHVVGSSFGAGVAVEVALTRPDLVRSLLLAPPGGSLLAELTPDLAAFFEAERAALAADDLDAAVEANLAWWVDGPEGDPNRVEPALREAVRVMQRNAFEVAAAWGEVADVELDPPALERLTEIRVPTLVLTGDLDLDTVADAADRLIAGIDGCQRMHWPEVAHLPAMERPAEFGVLITGWLGHDAQR